jgi:hypothetical protein
MSAPVFVDTGLVARLGEELHSWAGTPFFPRMAERGVGVDCVRFALAVLHGLGVVGPVDWPRYAIRGGGEELCTLIEQRLADISLQRVWRRGDAEVVAMPGDLIFADHPIHFALRGPNLDVWQCWHRSGVTTAALSSEAASRVRSIWRAFA